MKNFNFAGTILAKICIQSIFYVSAFLFPVNVKKITFASYRSEHLRGNLLFIYKELQARPEHYQCTLLFKKYDHSFLGKARYWFHLIRASYHLATSRYFFIDDYYFPIYVVKPRKRTEIVQLWHAAGSFKKFGYSTLGKTFGSSSEYLKHVKIHSNYSKVIVSSSEVIPHYAEAFNMPAERIFPLGVPRTDFFFQSHKHKKIKARFYQKYPELKDKKLILYAPTFRGKSHQQNEFHCPIDIHLLNQEIGDRYALLVHLHPYIRSGMNIDSRDKDFAYLMSGPFGIEGLMVLSDLLVTDYSSVIFEYSLLNRPMAFFADDLEDYLNERDFYHDYKEFIPGPIFTESKALAEWLKNGEFDLKGIEAFRDRFFEYTDGNASERVVNALLNS